MDTKKSEIISALPAPGSRTLVFGHRGAMAYAPQNTMTSFKMAWEMGADGIELDVQCSKDDVPVVFHDDTLDALTSGTGPVRNHGIAELLSMDAGSHFSAEFSHERMPLLETVLRGRPAGTFINIELKTDMLFDPMWKQLIRPITGYPEFSVNPEGPREREASRVARLTAECIRKVAVDDPELPAHIIVSSFDPVALISFAGEFPGIPIASLYYKAVHFDTKTFVATMSHQAWHPYWFEVSKKVVGECHARGRWLNSWTVNKPSVAKRLIRFKADGLITNYPDVMLGLLSANA
jgi:glycerophosphoryl diester phosphodiesterase